MGRKKEFTYKRTVLQFKMKPEEKKKFNKITKESLLSSSCAVLNAFVEEFNEEWKTDKDKLVTKYFKKK